jgi:hypothetical protein
LLCNRRINKGPFLGNGSVKRPTTTEELFKSAFSIESAQRLHNEDPRPAERISEKRLATRYSVFHNSLRDFGGL